MGDPGLQGERTALAWQRTGLVGSLVGGVAVLAAAHRRSAVLAVGCAVVAGAAAALAGFAATRPTSTVEVPLPSPWRRLVAAALIPVLLAVTGLVLVLV